MIILKDKIFSDERLDKIEIEFPGIKIAIMSLENLPSSLTLLVTLH